MAFKHMLVAIDQSDAGRNAARSAADLAGQVGGELTVLSVFPATPWKVPEGREELDSVQAMLGQEIFARHPSLSVELAVARGVPQVEIPRFAERVNANLIVLGRKPRSRATRLMLGDTADAVVRRSRLPALLVPATLRSQRRVLVALDGTDRGVAVLRAAAALAREANLEINAVTVEPAEHGAPLVISSRSERLAGTVEDCLRRGVQGENRNPVATQPLRVRQGDIVEEIVAEAVDSQADIVVTGFHPGGPLLVVDEGSISRRLLHAAPCAVLTVPL